MSEYFFIRGNEDFKRPGMIPDSFVEKALGYFEREGSPFLQNHKKAKHQIYLDGCNTLHLGKPSNCFPEIPTWRKYLKEYEGYTDQDIKNRLNEITCNLSRSELDDELDFEYFMDQWAHNYSPAAEFVHLIDQLKVGIRDKKAGDVLGSLKRYEGAFSGSDVLCMFLEEPITLSWLQWAMEQAKEPCNIHNL